MVCVVSPALLQLVVARIAKVRISACEVIAVVVSGLGVPEAIAQEIDSGVKPQRSGMRTRGC